MAAHLGGDSAGQEPFPGDLPQTSPQPGDTKRAREEQRRSWQPLSVTATALQPVLGEASNTVELPAPAVAATHFLHSACDANYPGLLLASSGFWGSQMIP